MKEEIIKSYEKEKDLEKCYGIAIQNGVKFSKVQTTVKKILTDNGLWVSTKELKKIFEDDLSRFDFNFETYGEFVDFIDEQATEYNLSKGYIKKVIIKETEKLAIELPTKMKIWQEDLVYYLKDNDRPSKEGFINLLVQLKRFKARSNTEYWVNQVWDLAMALID
jgi:hypothetical protein